MTTNTAAAVDQQSLISIGAGSYNAFDDESEADFRLEYRSGKSLFTPNLHPYIGAEVTSDFSTWVGVGLLYDWNVAPNIYVTPSFGAGLYTDGSSDKDLGYPLEFRTQLEVSYEFQNQHRLGAAISHLSNASLGDHNPGTEALNIYWHIPMGDLF